MRKLRRMRLVTELEESLIQLDARPQVKHTRAAIANCILRIESILAYTYSPLKRTRQCTRGAQSVADLGEARGRRKLACSVKC